MRDWDDIRFFLGIIRAGSQSAAARQLGVDQTTVGRRLAALEEQLGTRLVTRGPRGFVLTPAGHAIRAEAERVEEAVLAVERIGAGLDERLSGNVRIATTDALARGFVLPALSRLRARHPDIRTELITSPQSANIARREADVAVRQVRPTAPDLRVRKLGTIAHALYASRAYLASRGAPRGKRGLEGHDLLIMAPEVLPEQQERIVGEATSSGRVVLRANNVVSLIHAALLGMGIAPLPTFLGDREPELVRIRPEREERQDVWLVVHADMRSAARVRAVVGVIAEAFGARPE